MAFAADQPLTNESRALARTFAILGGFFLVLAAGAYLYGLDYGTAFPRDGSTLVVGRDFLNFWMYGRAAALPDPGQWYNPVAYAHALAGLLGSGYPGQNWSYPPTVMLLAAPFGQIGYLPALLIWTVLNLSVFLAVAMRRIADRRTLLALMVSPAAIFCLISGQSSFLTTAMMIGIFAFLDRRPLLAGLLVGLLTIKPQLGVLIPVVLIATGRWRVFAVATATALALAGLTVALFGMQTWIDFVTQGLPTQNLVLADPEGIATPFYPTVFMNLRGIGFNYSAAMAVQLCFAAAAVAAVAWAFRCRADADPRLLFALFIACSITAVPYLLVYDTLALCLAVLMLLDGNRLDRTGAWLARPVYWLPLLQIGLGTFDIPGPGFIAPVLAFYIVQRLREAREGALRPALNPG